MGPSTVRDLILARTGHLREEGANMTTCPAHRAQLGIFWKSEGQAMEGR